MMVKLKSKYAEARKWLDENIPNLRPKDLGKFYGLKMQIEKYGEFKEVKNSKHYNIMYNRI